ncbi:MAG: helix-turn-helix domain-containing protein [Propionibacteriaceae bacterium]|nr:helix-turn-helix domain-containing protein [Propionibacteriaceae bacterium]
MATKTAAQRRRARKDEYNERLRECPSRRLLEIVSNKWVLLIVLALGTETLRYSELQREIPGASPKMLIQTLRLLERDGLVARTVAGDVPPRVDYRLTPLGASLLDALSCLKVWADDHIAEIDAARTAHEGRLTRVGGVETAKI